MFTLEYLKKEMEKKILQMIATCLLKVYFKAVTVKTYLVKSLLE